MSPLCLTAVMRSERTARVASMKLSAVGVGKVGSSARTKRCVSNGGTSYVGDSKPPPLCGTGRLGEYNGGSSVSSCGGALSDEDGGGGGGGTSDEGDAEEPEGSDADP